MLTAAAGSTHALALKELTAQVKAGPLIGTRNGTGNLDEKSYLCPADKRTLPAPKEADKRNPGGYG